jgi:nitroreductase
MPVELSEAMSTCRAIRRYSDEPVSDEVLLECLRLAMYAPSGSNQQKYRFCILRAPHVRELLGKTYRQGWSDYAEQMSLERPADDDISKRGRFIRSMFELVENFDRVPAYVLFCALRTPFMEELYTGASIYPTMQNFILAARERGIGTVVTTWYRLCEDELRALVGVPEGWVIAALLPGGHPKGHFGPLKRRPAEQMVCLDQWDAVLAQPEERRV